MSDAELKALHEAAQALQGRLSDGAIIAIVAGIGGMVTSIIGFLTLWVRLKYGVAKPEHVHVVASKIDANTKKLEDNTLITTEAKEAATKASEHSELCDLERSQVIKKLSDHDARITSLEAKVAAIKESVDGVSKNIDSTRHEMRGHLQTLTGKLDLIAFKPKE